MIQLTKEECSIERFIDPFECRAELLRGKVLQLEEEMRKQPNHIEIATAHYFAPGLYAREIFIPKGTLLTGKIHLFGHLNIISKGEISVLTEEGMKRIKAPCTLVSRPGIKRLGLAHEDTVWTTIHACCATSEEEAEKLLVVDTFKEYEEMSGGGKCLLLP